MNEAVCWGVFREREHSPGREDDDARILRRAAERLEGKGWPVRLLEATELAAAVEDGTPSLVFYMCERRRALETLAALAEQGAILVNPLAGVWNTYRDRMTERLEPMGPSFPRTRLVATDAPAAADDGDVWVKRGDFHQTEKGDVTYAADPVAVEEALGKLAARGIASAVLQEHVEGDLLKFYGVGREDGDEPWFHHFYHRNQTLRHHPFDVEALKRLVREAARRMDLEVYGGDVIVTAEGRLAIIDMNAWPSFALVCDEAAAHIAGWIESRLDAGTGRGTGCMATGRRREDT